MRYLSILLFFFLLFLSCKKNDENKKIKILWIKDVYNNEYKMKLSKTFINAKYIKNCSEQEKTVIAYLSSLNGSDCYYKNDCLECELIKAVKVDCQSSANHFKLIKKWFKEKNVLDELEMCYSLPNTATSQSNFNEINFRKKQDTLFVDFLVETLNSRENFSTKNKDSLKFLILKDEIKILK